MSELNIPSFGARAQALVATAGDPAALNPANSQEEKLEESREMRTRIPMSVPRAKLSTPEIPGYHSHWINDYTGRILQAQQAGYEFVSQSEALVSAGDLAGNVLGAGTDLGGSRVSVVVGKGENNEPLRAYLMKIRNEWYKEDQKAIQGTADRVDAAMRQGKQETGGADGSNRYVKSVSMKSTYSSRG